MRLRAVVLALLLVAGFAIVTSRAHWNVSRLMHPVASAAKPWAEPVTARTAGLSSDEQNNIDIYKAARTATVNITSTVYRRGFFYEVYPSKDIGSGFIIS